MSTDPSLAIDIEKIIKSRAGNKKIPGFLISWLKKAIHQDFLNGYLTQGYEGVEFCERSLEYLGVNVNVEGLENLDSLPEDAHLTFASNHPLGGIDGITLGAVIGRRYDGKIRYLVNDLLMNLKGLAPLCVPINKIGGQARNLPVLINEAFQSDDQMIIFPAGLCSRKTNGVICDREWGKAFIAKSVQTGRYVVPVHFIGENSKRFYRVANLCKKLKLKFNFAMLLLPDELYKGRGKTFTVKFGEPVPSSVFDSSKTAVEWAQWVKEKCYSL